MRTALLALPLAVALLPALALADDPAPRHRFSVAPEVLLPFGDLAEVSGPGLGLELGYAYEAGTRLAFTGRVAYLHHLDEEVGGASLHTVELPLLAGVRFDLVEGLYSGLEAGAVHLRYETERDGEVALDDGWRFGAAVGAGWRSDTLDVGARLFLPDLAGREEGVDPSVALGLHLGWTFAAL